MDAVVMCQRQIAASVGITRPAVSRQLRLATELVSVHPQLLIDAAAPILHALGEERGYTRSAVFGSVARRQAREDSDLDLLVEPPAGGSAFVAFQQLIQDVLGREIDLISYRSLTPVLDDDTSRETVPLCWSGRPRRSRCTSRTAESRFGLPSSMAARGRPPWCAPRPSSCAGQQPRDEHGPRLRPG